MAENVSVLKNRVFVAAVILILLGLGLLYLTSQFPPSPQPGYPGPGFFPNLVIAGIILCCLILIYQEVTRKEEIKTIQIDWKNPDVPKTIFILVMTTAYILLMGAANFYVLTICLLIISMQALKPGNFPQVLWSRDRLRLILVTALFVVGGIYLLFDKFLQIPLP